MFSRSGTHSKREITAPPDDIANKLRLQHPPPALLVSQQQSSRSDGAHKRSAVSRHKSHPVDNGDKFSASMEVERPRSPSRKKKNMFSFLKKKHHHDKDHTDGGSNQQRAMSRTPEHFGRKNVLQDNPLSVPPVRRPHSAASDRHNNISRDSSSKQHRYYYNTSVEDSDEDDVDQPKITPTTSGKPQFKPLRVAPPIPIQTPPNQSSSVALPQSNAGYDSLEKYRSGRLSQSDDGSLGSATSSSNTVVPGLIGIKNHGNTCFMNAVFQCLSNTKPLLNYILTNSYKRDLFNKRKPSGNNQLVFTDEVSQVVIPNSDGAVTECIGLLIRSLWNGQYEPKVSSFAREVIGLWGDQYRGSSQHDAQEFLLWLLDHLHEDLNKATGEKMTMSPIRKSNEAEMAAETLSDHLQRHDSLIYNLFSAQYHSSLQCPGCGHLSNTFDPYLCISLSVPRRGTRPLYITMARRYQSSTKLMMFGMSLKVTASVRDIQRQLSVEARTLPHYLVITDMKQDGSFRFYRPNDPLSSISDHLALYAFEVTPYKGEFAPSVPHPPSLVGGGGGETIFIILQCRVGQGEYSKRFGSPMCLRVWRDLTYSQLQSVVFKHMKEYLHDGVNPEVVCRDYIFFRCLVMDGLQGQEYLDPYCPAPFMAPSVEKALSVSKLWGYESHIKIIAEWEQWVKDTVCSDIPELPECPHHPTVKAVSDHFSIPLEATLDDCLEWHTKEEKLDEDETYRCSQCSKPQAGAIKRISFWTLPDIMIIHLKRFELDEYSHSKLNTLVKYPVRGLDMTPYLAQPNSSRPFSANGFKEQMLKATPSSNGHIGAVMVKSGSVREKKGSKGSLMEKQGSCSTLPLKGVGFDDMRKLSIDSSHPKSKQKFVWKKPKKSKKQSQPQPPSPDNNPISTDTTIGTSNTTTVESNLYDLYAVCNHHGSMDSGHYIAVCCNPVDGSWYTYDDHRIIPVTTEDNLITQYAYMLMYVRRGVNKRDETTPTTNWIHKLTQFKMDLSRIIPSVPPTELPSVSKAQRQASAQTLSTISGVSPDLTLTSMPRMDHHTGHAHVPLSAPPTHYHQSSNGSSSGPISPSHSTYSGYPQSIPSPSAQSTVSYFSQPSIQPFTKRIGSYHGHTHHGTRGNVQNGTASVSRTATRL